MSRPLRLLLILVALPIAFVVGLFAFGFVRGLLDPASVSPPTQSADASDPETKSPSTNHSPAPPANQAPAEPKPVSPRVSVPSDLTTDGVQSFLVSSGLLRVTRDTPDGEAQIKGYVEGFASLTVDDAVRLHDLLEAGGDEWQNLRIQVFAWLSYLPTEARASFCERVGAVYATSVFAGRAYRGDFTRLFYYQVDDPDSIFAIAVRRYAAVLESDAILDALKAFGTIYEEPEESIWRLYVEEKMQSFDAQTLLALRERIDLFYGLGDRKYLRAELADLAAAKTESK